MQRTNTTAVHELSVRGSLQAKVAEGIGVEHSTANSPESCEARFTDRTTLRAHDVGVHEDAHADPVHDEVPLAEVTEDQHVRTASRDRTRHGRAGVGRV